MVRRLWVDEVCSVATRVHPYVSIFAFSPDSLQKMMDDRLVFRFEPFPSEDGDTVVLGLIQNVEDFVFDDVVKRLPVFEVPCLWLETARAMDAAA